MIYIKKICKKIYSRLFGISKKVRKVKFINHSYRIYKCKIIGKKSSIGNIIEIRDNAYVKNCKFEVYGNYNKVTIGKDTILTNITIYCEGDGNLISIGDGTTMAGTDRGCVHLAALEGCSISIGKDCMFADNISIRTSDSHSILNEKNYRINPARDIVIGNHVWIGTGVLLLKQSVIGNNCIIGAGTILSSKVLEDNVLIAGVPGKVLRRNINWDRKQL